MQLRRSLTDTCLHEFLGHVYLAVRACLHLAMAPQGTYVASGTATAVVVATGDRTFIAGIARMLAAQPQLNGWTTGAPFPAHSL